MDMQPDFERLLLDERPSRGRASRLRRAAPLLVFVAACLALLVFAMQVPLTDELQQISALAAGP